MIAYKEEIEELLKHELLETKVDEKLPNLLEIGKGVKELTISNLYAYFLTPSESHGLGNLFLKSLFELKDFNIKINDYAKVRVHRETKTEDGKFIDLVINDGEDVIVIENKLYAGLYNKLDSYENHFREDCKECIILSVESLPEKIGNYHTITHQQLFEKIESNFNLMEIRLSERQKVNFESFIEILKKHYKIVENLNEKIEFISSNKDKISTLVQLINEIQTSYISKAGIVAKLFLKDYAKITVQKSNSITFTVNGLNLYGYISFSPNDISKLVLSVWIANHKKWVEEWHKDGYGKFSEIVNKFPTLWPAGKENDSKSWASMVYKMYDLKIENSEKFEEEFKASIQHEWIPFFDKLKLIS